MEKNILEKIRGTDYFEGKTWVSYPFNRRLTHVQLQEIKIKFEVEICDLGKRTFKK